MKQSFFIFLIFIANNYYCQTKIVDIGTQNTVSNVHLVSDLGKIIDISDKNGKVNIDKIKKSKFRNITFHHVGYKDYRISTDSLNFISIIYLEPKVTYLKEFSISDKEPIYMKLTGYYRSYTTRNDIPFLYSDGIINYYVPLKKRKKKIKMTVDEYRTFINPKEREEIELTPAGKLFFKLSPSRPNISKLLIPSKSIIKDNIIFKGSDSVGTINKNDDNQKIQVNIDYLAPNSIRTDTNKMLSLVYNKTESLSLKIFNDSLELKNLTHQMYVYEYEAISLKNDYKESWTYFKELNVIEVSYIYSKKEITKSYTYGNFHSYYSSDYWKKWEGTSFVDKLLHKLLIEQPVKNND